MTTDLPPALSVAPPQVLASIQSFPKGTSPGSSQLRAQHLLDVLRGTTTPAAIDCLSELTTWINILLAGRAHPLISPWLCGAPLTALNKKNGGVRPIAVGETIRRLISKLCCSFIHPFLPEMFLPEGQVGVGIRGGLEAAIHASRYYIQEHHQNTDLCLLKVDFTNAFNEVNREVFLDRVQEDLPELFGWTNWCYSRPANLFFGDHRITATGGVQQGDPLGPLLFSLVLSDLLRSLDVPSRVDLNIWYLDDGSLIGPRSIISQVVKEIETQGPQYGLLLNLSKCELYWPSGNTQFPEFPPEITRLKEGVSLLGSPLWGAPSFFSATVAQLIDKTTAVQEKRQPPGGTSLVKKLSGSM